MRISDWSSDVCSSDLREHVQPGWRGRRRPGLRRVRGRPGIAVPGPGDHGHGAHRPPAAVMLPELSARPRSCPLAAPVPPTPAANPSAETTVVEIHASASHGRAASVPYPRCGETYPPALNPPA